MEESTINANIISYTKVVDDITLEKIDLSYMLEQEKSRQNSQEFCFTLFVGVLITFIVLLLRYPSTHFLTFISILIPL